METAFFLNFWTYKHILVSEDEVMESIEELRAIVIVDDVKNQTYTKFNSRLEPYSLDQYKLELEAVLQKKNEIQLGDLDQDFLGISGSSFEYSFSAQQSVLARKRKTGMLLELLYLVAAHDNIDMTATLASRICNGWVGKGISNKTLIKVFSEDGRTASSKSKDFKNLAHYIDSYKDLFNQAFASDKAERVAFQAMIKHKISEKPQ